MAQDTTDQTAATPDVGVILCILSPDAAKHIEWLKTVFDARVKKIFNDEATKKVVHAALDINGGAVYFSDSSCMPEQQEKSVPPAGSDIRGLVSHLNLKDPHPIWKKALENGAKVVVEIERQFWGDVYGSFRDPFGYEWGLCSCSPVPAKSAEGEELLKED